MQGHPNARPGSPRKRQLGGGGVQIQAAGVLPSPHLLQQPNLKPSSGGEPEPLTDPQRGLQGRSGHLCHPGIDGNQASASIMEETAKMTACACKTMPWSSRRSSIDHNPSASSPGPRDLHPGRVHQPGQRSHPHCSHHAQGCKRSYPAAFPGTGKAGTRQGNMFSA